MTRIKAVIPACALALLAISCYDFVSQTTVMSGSPTWTGSSHYTWGTTYGGHVVGLAGQDIYWIQGNSASFWNDPLLDEFGGPYVLTSVAQTHTLGFHEHTFIHGNLVGETDNLSLLYTSQGSPWTMGWVDPQYPVFVDGGQTFEVTQICDLAASADGSFGDPSDASSHLYMSFRACLYGTTSSCRGGIMEVGITGSEDWWYIDATGATDHVWTRKTDNSPFSNECMPIAVTGRGDQAEQYLVVGDPSWDELTLFDAHSIGSGPLDSLRVYDSSYDIRDLVIEGRGDGATDYGFLATLWSSASATRLEHRTIVNGTIPDDPPHLIESLPSDVRFIASRGQGVEGTSEQLYTFGSLVRRRYYEQ